jgi:hypothetical protein
MSNPIQIRREIEISKLKSNPSFERTIRSFVGHVPDVESTYCACEPRVLYLWSGREDGEASTILIPGRYEAYSVTGVIFVLAIGEKEQDVRACGVHVLYEKNGNLAQNIHFFPLFLKN